MAELQIITWLFEDCADAIDAEWEDLGVHPKDSTHKYARAVLERYLSVDEHALEEVILRQQIVNEALDLFDQLNPSREQ